MDLLGHLPDSADYLWKYAETHGGFAFIRWIRLYAVVQADLALLVHAQFDGPVRRVPSQM